MANPLSSFSLDYRYFLRLVANKDVEVSAFEEIKRAVDARKYCQFVRNSETLSIRGLFVFLLSLIIICIARILTALKWLYLL